MEHAPPTHPADDPSRRRHHVLVVLLATTSGALDALGFLGLGGVFASVMTGNLVLLGLGAGTRHGSLAVHAATAIAAYALGVAVGGRLARDGPPADAPGWSRRLHVLIAVELALVVAFAVGWNVVPGRSSTSAQLVLVALAAAAMGLQSAAIRVSTRDGLSTTYLTGTLTGVVMALAGGRPLRGEWSGLSVLGAALVGAALAGTVLTEWASWAPLVPVTALAAVVVVGRTLTAPPGDGPPTR